MCTCVCLCAHICVCLQYVCVCAHVFLCLCVCKFACMFRASGRCVLLMQMEYIATYSV